MRTHCDEIDVAPQQSNFPQNSTFFTPIHALTRLSRMVTSFLAKSCPLLLVAYLGLLSCHLPILGPLLAADLLAPLIALSLLANRDYRSLVRIPYSPFLAMLCCLGLVTISHLPQGGESGYNLAVLAYLFVLFVAFREHPLSRKTMLISGVAILSAILLGWCYDAFASQCLGINDTGFAFISPDQVNSNLSFLERRYAFLFKNPNTLGSFYPLPMALALLGLQPKLKHASKSQWIAILVAIAATLVPLAATLSKHAILTQAIVLAFLVHNLPVCSKKVRRFVAIAIFLCSAIVCETTVLFVTFPLKSTPPFINSTPGMYAIHQVVYAKMPFINARTCLLGQSPEGIKKTYPKLADVNSIRKTLEQYGTTKNLEMYATFIDPHNEYLNLAAFYGIPATLLVIAAFIALAWNQRKAIYAGAFIAALAVACLWDDLLSKRWICITLAILTQRQDDTDDQAVKTNAGQLDAIPQPTEQECDPNSRGRH